MEKMAFFKEIQEAKVKYVEKKQFRGKTTYKCYICRLKRHFTMDCLK